MLGFFHILYFAVVEGFSLETSRVFGGAEDVDEPFQVASFQDLGNF